MLCVELRVKLSVEPVLKHVYSPYMAPPLPSLECVGFPGAGVG